MSRLLALPLALPLAAAAVSILVGRWRRAQQVIGLVTLTALVGVAVAVLVHVDGEPSDALLDPLPQAFVLTAIVITFGVTSFLLALAYRSWRLTGDDEVQDDLEDRLIANRWAAAEELADAVVADDLADLQDVDEPVRAHGAVPGDQGGLR